MFLALVVTLLLGAGSQELEPQNAPSTPPTCGPCCPPALAGFCRVGCPPPYPVAVSFPSPDVTHLAHPQPKGIVIVEIGVNGEGRVVSACVLRGIRPDADRAAQDAALRSRWTPKLLDGVPVGVVRTVTFRFPPAMRWTRPAVMSKSALPIAAGGIVYVEPSAACPAGLGKDAVRLGATFNPPLLDYVEPKTPPASDLPGTVIIEVVIGPDGKVTRARALRGDPRLTAPAITAAREWRFARTCVGGKAVQVIKTMALSHVARQQSVGER